MPPALYCDCLGFDPLTTNSVSIDWFGFLLSHFLLGIVDCEHMLAREYRNNSQFFFLLLLRIFVFVVLKFQKENSCTFLSYSLRFLSLSLSLSLSLFFYIFQSLLFQLIVNSVGVASVHFFSFYPEEEEKKPVKATKDETFENIGQVRRCLLTSPTKKRTPKCVRFLSFFIFRSLSLSLLSSGSPNLQ